MSLLKKIAKPLIGLGAAAIAAPIAMPALASMGGFGQVLGMSTFGLAQTIFNTGFQGMDSFLGAMGMSQMTPGVGPADVVGNWTSGMKSAIAGAGAGAASVRARQQTPTHQTTQPRPQQTQVSRPGSRFDEGDGARSGAQRFYSKFMDGMADASAHAAVHYTTQKLVGRPGSGQTGGAEYNRYFQNRNKSKGYA